jgi:putative ATPase
LSALLTNSPDLRFDAIVGFNALLTTADKPAALTKLVKQLADEGVLSLAERMPSRGQRLYALVDGSELDDDLRARWHTAEEAIYADADDPLVNWTPEELVQALQAAGLTVTSALEEETSEVRITSGMLARWFGSGDAARPSYAARLATKLDAAELNQIEKLFMRQLANQTVPWSRQVLYLQAT